jgi:hypothetical protein
MASELPWLVFGLIVFLAIFLPLRRALLKPKRKPQANRQTKDLYRELRNLALTSNRAKLGLEAGNCPNDPWGVLMDWHIDTKMVTAVSIIDGSASVYSSSGGGSIGGQSIESIGQAAKRAVAAAVEALPQARLTQAFPLPQKGEVFFYILTDSGVFAVAAPEESLRKGTSTLSRLGYHMQEVISEFLSR